MVHNGKTEAVIVRAVERSVTSPVQHVLWHQLSGALMRVDALHGPGRPQQSDPQASPFLR
jgi:hypothetical protein